MSDKELASWQAGFDSDTPQYLLATQEWQRRISAQQVQAIKFAAWVGLIGAIAGAAVGAGITPYVGNFQSEDKDNNKVNTKAYQDKNLVKIPIKPAQ